MERIDKFITNHTAYSRSEVKLLISKKRVFVNDEVIKKLMKIWILLKLMEK